MKRLNKQGWIWFALPSMVCAGLVVAGLLNFVYSNAVSGQVLDPNRIDLSQVSSQIQAPAQPAIILKPSNMNQESSLENDLSALKTHPSTVNTISGSLDNINPNLPLLNQIKSSGQLIVVTKESASGIYYAPQYNNRKVLKGYEYKLLERFARELNVQLKIIFVSTQAEASLVVESGMAHIAANDYGLLSGQTHSTHLSNSIRQSKWLAITHKDRENKLNAQEINQFSAYHLGGSDFSKFNNDSNSIPNWLTDVFNPLFMDDLSALFLIDQKALSHILIEQTNYKLLSGLFTNLTILNIPHTKINVHWQVTTLNMNTQDLSLLKAVNHFIKKQHQTGQIASLQQDFFNIKDFNYAEKKTLKTFVKSRLPKYKSAFKSMSEQTRINWQLLASVGYQESLWNPEAVSPTGVKGLMMLTIPTAKEMRVSDRTNASQSIQGGSKYLAKLYNRLPSEIDSNHRYWLALAAYNAGYGHVLDARKLARQKGLNADNWFNVKKQLPLLTQKAYYSKSKYGFALSGKQAPHYVSNIRRYENYLTWEDKLNKQVPKLVKAYKLDQTRSIQLAKANTP